LPDCWHAPIRFNVASIVAALPALPVVSEAH
jgi:hypothetical protein